MRWTAVFLVLCFGTLAVAPLIPVAGQDPAAEATNAERIRIARLIKDLGSPSYAARESANAALEKVGAAGRVELEAAARSSDPEIRMRAGRLLKELKIQQLWQGSPVNIVADKVQASEIVNVLARQTGNNLSVGDQYGTFQESEVAVDYQATTFWEAVDDLCRKSGNRVRTRYGSSVPGTVFVSGDIGQYPVAYAGPVRAQITGAKRVFMEEYDYEDRTSETTHTFQFTMLVSWENRFRVVAHHTNLQIAAVTANVPAKMFGLRSSDGGWQVVENTAQQFSTTIRLQPPPQAATQLDELTLLWDVIAIGDPAMLVVEDFASDTVHRQDNLNLKIQQMSGTSETRWEMVIEVSRDLIVPDPEEILFLENTFQMFGANGEPFELRGTSRLGITDGVAKLKLTFVAPSAEIAPAQFMVHYPRIRDRRSLPITFRNVPLPTGKPE
jgi:hypothetical protein